MSRESTYALPSKRRKESLGKAATAYSQNLEVAETYLTGRGIPIEVAQRFGLGVVLDPQAGHEHVEKWLSIPYWTPHGCVDLKFRCMQDHNCNDHGHPKYLGETGSRARLFGVLAFQDDPEVICICEGELDTVCASGIAGLPAVGISGVNKWQPHWRFCFEGCEEVIVLKHGDTAGDKLANNVTSSVYNSRVVNMPTGHDVNSYIKEFGVASLRELVGIDEARG